MEDTDFILDAPVFVLASDGIDGQKFHSMETDLGTCFCVFTSNDLAEDFLDSLKGEHGYQIVRIPNLFALESLVIDLGPHVVSGDPNPKTEFLNMIPLNVFVGMVRRQQ